MESTRSVTLIFQIYEICEDLYLIEISKGKGDIFEYQRIYDIVKSSLLVKFPEIHVVESKEKLV